MTHERNDSLQVFTGPSIEFELCRVTQTENEHKNLLISCHVTRLKVALQDSTQPCLAIHHLRVFEKKLYLALFRSMDYHERQRSQFI